MVDTEKRLTDRSGRLDWEMIARATNNETSHQLSKIMQEMEMFLKLQQAMLSDNDKYLTPKSS